jgi:ATP-binding cassette subfamily B protein
MRIFLRTAALFWRYWPWAVIAYFCLFGGAGLALAIPRFTGQAVDVALSSGRPHMLVLLAAAIAGAGILRSILSYWQSYLSEFLSQRVAYDLRNLLYNHLQRLSYAFHDRSQTGQLISRATVDVDAVRMFVGFALIRGAYYSVLEGLILVH